MTRREKLLQIRLTEGEHGELVDRAEAEGLTVSNLVRRELGMESVKGRGRFPREPVEEVDLEDQRAVHEAIAAEYEPSLAERRESRARELAVSMPLREARVIAEREIPE